MNDLDENTAAEEIPSINFRNFLSVSSKEGLKKVPSHKLGAKPPQRNRNRQTNNGIFTVAESLKENYIVKSLQPDLGSLSTFINLKEKPDLENYRQSLKSMK